MWRFLRREVSRAIVRLLIAFGLFGLVSAVPWPPETAHLIAVGSFAALAAAVIVICGKLLYDTLYFDHYWRQMDSR